MCKFFSFCSDARGNYFYFDDNLRKKVLHKELVDYSPDSHTSIAHYFGYIKDKEDRLNKYEYNPITKKFFVDTINVENDSVEAQDWVENLNFKKIVAELNIKPLLNPLLDLKKKKVTLQDKKLLAQWDSVADSVGGFVLDSVLDSVSGSVGGSVGDSVLDSVGGSVLDSVRGSVGESVWESVLDSVFDSVSGYISSMFSLQQWKYIKHKPGVNPFQSTIDLWHKGLVPSFDGKVWRLHGHNGKILFEITPNKLKRGEFK